tara:strand:+ start:275 stop:445 length:171 start_codon:yes stop_codon:yes gene_type:complete
MRSKTIIRWANWDACSNKTLPKQTITEISNTVNYLKFTVGKLIVNRVIHKLLTSAC